jgi:hypothetical protein
MSADAIRSAGSVAMYVKESTAGTDPGGAFTITIAALGQAKLEKKQERRASQASYQGQGGLMAARYYNGRENIPWQAAHYLTFKGMGLLWSLILGDHGTTAANTPSAGVHTHTWDIQKDPKTATIAVVEGDALGSLTTQQFEGHGCVVSSAELSISAHEPAMLRLSGFGMSADAPTNASSITLTNDTYTEVHAHHAGTIAWNGSTYNFVSMRLTLPMGQIFRDVQGQAGTARPYSVNQREIRLTVVMDKIGNDFTGANTQGTESDLVLTYTDTAQSPNHTFTITLHNAEVLDSDGGNLEGYQLVRETITFAPKPDNSSGSDSGVRITIVNDQSTAESA